VIISYDSDEIRECCLLLRNAKIFSNFTIEEIKLIRSIIADLKAAPKLIDCPVKYTLDKDLGIVNIEYGIFKIVCTVITSLTKLTHDKIERLKIVKIINVRLEEDLTRKDNLLNF